jgi:hypothetical protein
MFDLDTLVGQVRGLQTKVILLVGPPPAARTVMAAYAKQHDAPVVSVGAALSRQLLAVQKSYRPIEAARIFREIIDNGARNGIALLANLEVLFDCTLELNPLLLMRQSARHNVLIAQWPGTLQGGRLIYAAVGHSEHKDYEPTGIQLASVA